MKELEVYKEENDQKVLLLESLERINGERTAELEKRIKGIENGMSRVMGEYGDIVGQMQGIRIQLEKISNKCFLCLGQGKIFIHCKDSKPIERECGRCSGSGLLVRVP